MTELLLVSQAQYIFIHDALMEYVTCGDTEFVVRELPEKLRILNTIDPDSGDSLLVAQFKVCARARTCVHCEKLSLLGRVTFHSKRCSVYFLFVNSSLQLFICMRAITNLVWSQGDVDGDPRASDLG